MRIRNVVDKTGIYLSSNNYQRLKQIAICYSIFLISFAIRAVIETWFLHNYDFTPYISPAGHYWETYQDATDYYQSYLYAFRYQNWNLYGDMTWPFAGYVYGPIFAYMLVFLSYFVQIFNPSLTRMELAWETVTIAPAFFDSLTTILIFLIIQKSAKKKIKGVMQYILPLIGSIIYTFLPVVLFYNTVVYLNTYMFTFFTVLALYFLISEKHKLSASFLVIAVFTKLIALYLVPIFFLYYFRNDIRKSLEFLSVLFIVGLIISLPWIFIHGLGFFRRQLWTGTTINVQFSILPMWRLWSTTPFHAFLYWEWEGLALFYFEMNELYLPLFLFFTLCYFAMMLVGPHLYKKKGAWYSFLAMFVIGTHLFQSRGNYKYYDPFFMPFLIIAFAQLYRNIKWKSLATAIFLALISWLFVVNVWIILQIKWLHMFYVFLLLITAIATYDLTMHLTFWKPQNYKDLVVFSKESIMLLKQKISEKKLIKKKKKKKN